MFDRRKAPFSFLPHLRSAPPPWLLLPPLLLELLLLEELLLLLLLSLLRKPRRARFRPPPNPCPPPPPLPGREGGLYTCWHFGQKIRTESWCGSSRIPTCVCGLDVVIRHVSMNVRIHRSTKSTTLERLRTHRQHGLPVAHHARALPKVLPFELLALWV